MEAAFLDSSSLVPLCVNQSGTPASQALSAQYAQVVWWAAPVQMRGAFSRLLRMNLLTPAQHAGAQLRLTGLRSLWVGILPASHLRAEAERLVDSFALKAADALQLAAAVAWTSGQPTERVFISGDEQLLAAADRSGFKALRT